MAKKKTVGEMTRKEFEALPLRKSWDEIVHCLSIVILPTRRVHDSGYRCLDFVAVGSNSIPICRVSGCSDVLHIDGIGGYGKWKAGNGVPRSVEPKGWSIDCLKTSGLLRLFCNGPLECGAALSSFSLYGRNPEREPATKIKTTA